MADLRFCAYQYQHLPLDDLRARWREAEQAGFDAVVGTVIPRLRAASG